MLRQKFFGISWECWYNQLYNSQINSSVYRTLWIALREREYHFIIIRSLSSSKNFCRHLIFFSLAWETYFCKKDVTRNAWKIRVAQEHSWRNKDKVKTKANGPPALLFYNSLLEKWNEPNARSTGSALNAKSFKKWNFWINDCIFVKFFLYSLCIVPPLHVPKNILSSSKDVSICLK